MGSYNFTWQHPAEEVYVTGTFDNWSKSVKLDKKDQLHEKLVNLPKSEKVFYKFVADGNWSHDHTAKTETDHEGNVNNVLYPEDIKPVNSMAHSLSSVAPGATTASLAGQQPLEKDKDVTTAPSSVPGAFPETPGALTGVEKTEEQSFSVNPIPASAGTGNPISLAAGEKVPDPSSITQNTITSTVLDDPSLKSSTLESEQTFGVAPLPATDGIGNPMSLAPGEKVPDSSSITQNTIGSTVHDDPSLKSSTQESDETVGIAPLPATSGIGNPISLAPGEKVPESSSYTANDINSHVKLDKESYENSGSGVPSVSSTSDSKRDTVAGGALLTGLGPQTTNMIPESSLGMGADAPAPLEGQAVHSVGPNSTTNQLAGQVPLEPRGVPEVVKESQQKAGVDPEASANLEAVQEKKELESELTDKIGKPENQTNSAIGGTFGGALAGAGATALGVAAVARQKTHETTGTDPVSLLPTSLQKTVDENTRPTGAETTTLAADTVPVEVKESQKEAHVAPEASANPEAVDEKRDVEKELLEKVPESQAAGEPAPTASATTTSVAPVATPSAAPAADTSAPATEPVATNSTSAAGAPQLADPTAGVAALSLDDKSKELNAPASSHAQVSSPPELAAHPVQPRDSRDVSPMSKPNPVATNVEQTAPVVTTGVDSSTAPAASSGSESKPVGTPRTAAGPSTPNKRSSIIDRLKGSKEGTPDSSKTDSSSTKKKGRLSRLFDKLKN